jgi:hypothetical protein
MLDLMATTSHLVRWNVPFAEARHPSVSLITEKGGDVATLVVAPSGIDQYPKYLVRFDKVLALLCHEEALTLGQRYQNLPGIESAVCAYIWADSPWLRDNRGVADLHHLPDLFHYVVFGGDSIVELLASGVSEIERINERTVIETKHEV